MIWASSEVPSVAVTRACVSPRVKSAEPWVRGRSPTSHVIGRICVEPAAVEALLPVEDRLARQDLDEVVGGLGAVLAPSRLLGLGNERDGGLLDGLDLGVGGDLVRHASGPPSSAPPTAAGPRRRSRPGSGSGACQCGFWYPPRRCELLLGRDDLARRPRGRRGSRRSCRARRLRGRRASTMHDRVFACRRR